MAPVRLVTLAPGHFHAALIQKEMLPAIDPRVSIYAPLDSDLVSHVHRVASYNFRGDSPTAWKLDIHAGSDYLERFVSEHPGTVLVLSGRNRRKVEWMRLGIDAGMHILADKPWVIEPDSVEALQEVLARAEAARLLVHDVMTERHEITTILQREIVDDPDLFGVIEIGDPGNPAVYMRSVHYLKKLVSGSMVRRPGWFFDIQEQGEGLADVGVHLVDQVLWMLFQDEPLDCPREVQIITAQRWPTVLSREQFTEVTRLPDFPPDLNQWRENGRLHFYGNNQLIGTFRGIHARLDVLWDFEAPPGGGDTYNSIFRGTRCTTVVRQTGGEEPELFVVPNDGHRQEVAEKLSRRIEAWQQTYPGVRLITIDNEFQINIPNAYRSTHEAHFAEVTNQFLQNLEHPEAVPSWEKTHRAAKYFITTHGVATARRECS